MYNKCLMIGNLTRDPETKAVGSGNLCRFSIAMNHRSKDKPETCFLDVVAWGKQADFVAQYFRKGKAILVEGRLKQETWEKDGKQNSKHLLVAERVSFIGSSDNQTTADNENAPMFKEQKRISQPSVTAGAFDRSPVQKAIGENNLDFEELPF